MSDVKISAESKNSSNKDLVREQTLKNIRKLYGNGAIMDNSFIETVETISTGSLGLDIALGTNTGLPKGRIIEIYGPESSGKTTLSLHIIAEAQKHGGTCAIIDVEHALDMQYAQRLGVNPKDLIISQPDYGEQALHIGLLLVESGGVDVVVIDSVAALTPRDEIQGEMGDPQMGKQARLMSQALRKYTASVSKTNCILIFINQIRMKIGTMFGNPETTTGGNALKFYSSVRLDIRKVSSIKNKDVVIGNLTRVKVVKNKVAPPFKQAEFDIIYNHGICRAGEALDLGIKYDVVSRNGAYYYYGNVKLGQGREAAKEFLYEHKTVMEDIIILIRAVSKEQLDSSNKKTDYNNINHKTEIVNEDTLDPFNSNVKDSLFAENIKANEESENL